MLINASTFTATETKEDGTEIGTVEVTLRGVTKTVEAKRLQKYNWIFASGVVGRYQTGGKSWPAIIHLRVNDGREHVDFGRDDRHHKFRKEDCIFFA